MQELLDAGINPLKTLVQENTDQISANDIKVSEDLKKVRNSQFS